MKKLKLEALEVATFATTPQVALERGTVRGNEASGDLCSTQDTRWDCSIDFCSHGCPPSYRRSHPSIA